MTQYVLTPIAVGLVCLAVALLIRRRRRSELERNAARLDSLGTVDAHREIRR